MRTASQSGRCTLTKLVKITKRIGRTLIPIEPEMKQSKPAGTTPGKTTTVAINETCSVLDLLSHWGYCQPNADAVGVWVQLLQSNNDLVILTG